MLKRLTGTKSFHNFCPRALPGNALRSVYRCRSGMTSGWTDDVENRSFAVVTVTGRSFLYHQIRSMMGLVVAVASGLVPVDYVGLALKETSAGEAGTGSRSLKRKRSSSTEQDGAEGSMTATGKRGSERGQNARVEVPLAPGENLILAACHFKSGDFAACVDGMGAQRSGVSKLSSEERGVRESIVDAVVAAGPTFDAFLQQLREVIAPRMRETLEERKHDAGE